jgi:hypothetical protein
MKRRKATPKAKHFVPTRLLDISGPPEKPVRIIETTSTPVHSPYCSLSHRWGKPDFVQLHIENRLRFMEKGVDWHLLPKNFQEAIEIARSLEVCYIWIDSLCIIQDSTEDWRHEAGLMHSVYRNSYCNIAIADSQGDRKGAFRTRKAEDVAPVRYQAPDESSFFGTKKWVVVAENLWDSELLQSDLYARGWVFQERMLSPRILHFTRRQVFWDCPSMSACETMPAGLPQPMDNAAGTDRHWRGRLQEPENTVEPLAGANDQSMDTFWKIAVRKYTSCDLTFGKDKLIAMWGIAKLMRDAMSIEYGMGLFEENLEDQLAWRVEECKLKVRPSNSWEAKVVRKVPSWSWASMDGTVIVPDRLSDQPHFKVTDHEGRALSFDLVGMNRPMRPIPSRAGSYAPPALMRGSSDSGPELQRRFEERSRQNTDFRKQKSFHSSNRSERLDRSLEPTFYSTSIRIHGHVGLGRLKLDSLNTGWRLELEDVSDGIIEAFPDLVPLVDDEPTLFMVLAAKQVIKPPSFVLEEPLEANWDPPTIEAAWDTENNTEDFDYAGHGILLQCVNKRNDIRNFYRTGAFRFRGASKRSYDLMQQTAKHADIPPKLYDKERGRKIWLA